MMEISRATLRQAWVATAHVSVVRLVALHENDKVSKFRGLYALSSHMGNDEAERRGALRVQAEMVYATGETMRSRRYR